jgi:hypothetical protein
MKHAHSSTLFWFFLAIGLLLFTACQKKSEVTPSLLGTWIESLPAQPRGQFVNQLTFTADNRFILKSSSYGLYEGQDINELTAWSEVTGNVVQQENTLLFLAEERTYWDSFYPAMELKTEKINQRLFDDCSYSVRGRRLDLVYTTYPADAPEITRKTFYKKD